MLSKHFKYTKTYCIKDEKVHQDFTSTVALVDSFLVNNGKWVAQVRYLERAIQKLVLLMSTKEDWDRDHFQPRSLNKHCAELERYLIYERLVVQLIG